MHADARTRAASAAAHALIISEKRELDLSGYPASSM
jgi:hypothetical protein